MPSQRVSTDWAAELRVNAERYIQRFNELSQIGRTDDGGCTRLALSDEDREARTLLIKWMKHLDLEVQVDRIGNIVGTYPGRRSGVDPVVIGSHMDTVPAGGKYDGVSGVIAGLEVISTLHEHSTYLERPIAIVNFTNEEGARFQPDKMGSSVWSGSLILDDALSTTDQRGVSVEEELKRIGQSGDAVPGAINPYVFLEMHIEQGPVLDSTDTQIGVVEAVQGNTWIHLSFVGESNHAGATPIEYRQDASLGVARTILCVRRLCRELPGVVATVGTVTFNPGAINVIPGQADLTIDLRGPNEAVLKDAEQRLSKYIDDIAHEESLSVSMQISARAPVTDFHQNVVTMLESSVEELGFSYRRMISGGGHDAQQMATIVPSGMIFVPSVRGLSHTPEEYTSNVDLISGVEVLLRTTIRTGEII